MMHRGHIVALVLARVLEGVLAGMLAGVLVLTLGSSSAWAFVPAPDRVAGAIAENNRASGRQESLRFELSMGIGDRVDIGEGELVTHPSGLARLELRGSGGLVERHLLRGTERLAARNGERIDDARFFLPPIFFLQSQSGAALRAALESFGIEVDVIGLAPCGEADCYVLGDPAREVPRPPYPPIRGVEKEVAAADEDEESDDRDLAEYISFSDGGTLADERAAADREAGLARAVLWIDQESYAIRRLDSRSGVRVTFGPIAVFDDLRVPSWFRIEEPEKSPVKFNVIRASKVSAPASAFSEEWLDTQAIPPSDPGDPSASAPAP